MEITEDAIIKLKTFIEPEKAIFFPKFFKSYPGGYGENDQFLGIRVPNIWKIAKEFRKKMNLCNIQLLISNSYHEIRMLGLFILILQFEKSKSNSVREEIANFYIQNIKYINNWDLVDCSAHKILGASLEKKERTILYEYAKSGKLWFQRIAMIATFWYIKKKDYSDALSIAEILKNHHHDLIHKAVGWMLREIGNRDRKVEVDFLDKYYKEIPRTMLRYAIEKFEPDLRKNYLNGKI